MIKIKSNENTEKVRGFVDKYSLQERDSNHLGREILKKYNYKPFELINLENQTFSPSSQYNSPEYGMSDMIYEVPEEDILNLKQVKPLNYLNKYFDSFYNIDYKSNNFTGDINSIYVHLMRHRSIRIYDEEKITQYLQRDRELYLKALEGGEEFPEFLMRKYFENKYLLGDKNYSDYIFYLKYDTEPEYILKQAYLVPAEKLRHQVIKILNGMLETKQDNDLIELRKDNFYLNLKIMKAYRIYNKNKDSFNDIEMFRTRGHSLMLKIPENILTDHIKFDKFGNIVG